MNTQRVMVDYPTAIFTRCRDKTITARVGTKTMGDEQLAGLMV